MAVDAFFQAELFGAYTLVHGFITLVQEVLHVISAHIRGGFDASLCFTHPVLCFGHYRQQRVTGPDQGRYPENRKRHQGKQPAFCHQV
jgi:hypothetical protein